MHSKGDVLAKTDNRFIMGNDTESPLIEIVQSNDGVRFRCAIYDYL